MAGVSTGWALALAVVLLVANGFFVAVEFAVVGSRRTRLERLVEEGSRRARHALAATADLNTQLAGAQLGITMASLGLGAVAEPAVAGLLEGFLGHTGAVVVALVLVVFLHLVVGEMVPKNVALTDPERWLLTLVGPNRAYVWLFGPVIRVLNAVAGLGMRLLGVEPRRALAAGHTAEELAVMLAASREEGLIAGFAHDLLAGVLEFSERDVASVMVPREQVVAIRAGTTVADAERVVVDTGHSRLPVVGRDLDDVRGFIHAKDLLTLPPEARGRPVPRRLLRRMLVVPTTRSLEDLLLGMRRARVHFALVVDEAGSTAGIVTLEDLLEELVGDIVDESDRIRRAPGPSPGRHTGDPQAQQQQHQQQQ
jgi:CBS domain containing-hemolysin-like protein